MTQEFKMTLRENGVHSLKRGFELFEIFKETSEDIFLLKESIMFLHHGIELLMKQVIIENAGEYLIYADISENTTKKVILAKKRK